jgi:hypothetical protein
MSRAFRFLAAIALFALKTAQGDELKLKDGSTISGTIVAFEESSFKVQTSYGFALVQKDQVVEIHMGNAAKNAIADKNSQPAAGKPSTPSEFAKPVTTEAGGPADKAGSRSSSSVASMKNLETSAATPSAPVITASPKRNSPVAAPIVVKEIARSLTVPSLPVAVTPPPKPAPPEPIREEVSGNVYKNETFGFRMYKPPDWQVIPSARTLLPGSIAAMGTDDENTYLLIGQQPAGKSLAADIDATERRLSNVMDNFRANGESRIMVSGISASERRFRGNVDQREWSGIVVFIPRNGQIFTIFGMTYAESDLVQIQENVLERAISSIQFINP